MQSLLVAILNCSLKLHNRSVNLLITKRGEKEVETVLIYCKTIEDIVYILAQLYSKPDVEVGRQHPIIRWIIISRMFSVAKGHGGAKNPPEEMLRISIRKAERPFGVDCNCYRNYNAINVRVQSYYSPNYRLQILFKWKTFISMKNLPIYQLELKNKS